MSEPLAIAVEALPTARHSWRSVIRRWNVVLPAVIILILLLIALLPAPFAGIFGHGDPRACDVGRSLAPPSEGHPFGLDVQGCDVYANVIYGTQSSLSVGVLATAVGLVIALVLGTLGGLAGRAVDWTVSRVTDIFLGFPFLLGAIVVLTAVGERSVLTVSLVLALFGWPTMARLMRSSVRSIRSADYVEAAVTMGIPRSRIIARYIIPNAISPMLVIATLSVGGVIVAESSLTYLGIGLQAPAISWGLQLASASSRFQLAPWLLVFPGLFLAITVLAITALGDALRVAFDPRRQQ
ncbi:ABC transporter permease [Microbacterium sp.]|uniref:ABC transporter permease n=1 Tax=Microbacterium sp. TaxID=51671 RepID=UPI0025E47CAD|nr:ABC transporter permease [Microbacterium sp.]